MAAIGNLLVNITGSIKGLQRSLDQATGAIQKAGSRWGNIMETAVGVAVGGAIVNTVSAIGDGLFDAASAGFEFNNQIEQTTAQLNAFTKDGAKTAEILAMIQERAAKTPFEFQEMASAAAALIPSANQAGVGLENLIEQAEILAASNPAQGLEGAAFALKEAVSGDFTSIIERFNLPRKFINDLKAQGVPALEIVKQAMQSLGLDTSLVSNLAETATGRWSTLKDTFVTLAGQVTQPIFNAFSGALGQLNQYLMDNQPLLTTFAQNLATGVQMAIDWFVNTGIPALQSAFTWITGTAIPTLMLWNEAYVMPALDWLINVGLPTLLVTATTFYSWLTSSGIPGIMAWGAAIGETLTPYLMDLQALLTAFVAAVLPPLQQAWQAIVTVWNAEVGPALADLWASLNELFVALGLGTGKTNFWQIALGALKVVLMLVVLGVQSLTPLIQALGAVIAFGTNNVKFAVDMFKNFVTGLNTTYNAVTRLIAKIQEMASELADMVIPDWLTPGSPTPFELGIRGIASAIDQLPPINLSPQATLAGAGAGAAGGTITINFNGGGPQNAQQAREMGFAVVEAMKSRGL